MFPSHKVRVLNVIGRCWELLVHGTPFPDGENKPVWAWRRLQLGRFALREVYGPTYEFTCTRSHTVLAGTFLGAGQSGALLSQRGACDDASLDDRWTANAV